MSSKIDAVVLFSGGLGSFLAAALYKQNHPDRQITLYFNDTKSEDPDLYRFVREGVDWLGLDIVDDSDGRHIWEVFRDAKYIGNTRIDPCSDILKRRRSKRWIKKNAPLSEIVIGIDWTEIHRVEEYQARSKNLIVAPLCEDLRAKQEIYESLDNPPRLPSLFDILTALKRR